MRRLDRHSGAAAASAHDGVLGSIDVADAPVALPGRHRLRRRRSRPPRPRPATAARSSRRRRSRSRSSSRRRPAPPRTGEDQRTAWLHRDQDLLNDFPRTIGEGGAVGGPESAPTADGASSPAFADLDGDNRNELVFADSDGFVHAIDADGSELPGWPVRGDVPGFVAAHAASPAYASGAVARRPRRRDPRRGRDRRRRRRRRPRGLRGRRRGQGLRLGAPTAPQVFEEQSNPDYSGKPLTPFVNVRNGKANRTQHGFFGAPVLADLDGDGTQEVIAASMDRHVYAWNGDDSDPARPAAPPRPPASRSSSSTRPRSPRSTRTRTRSPSPPAPTR